MRLRKFDGMTSFAREIQGEIALETFQCKFYFVILMLKFVIVECLKPKISRPVELLKILY